MRPDLGAKSRLIWYVFYANNFHSQKSKPSGRTTRFSAWVHCQDKKRRRIVFDEG
jgi:hypothetical protein